MSKYMEQLEETRRSKPMLLMINTLLCQYEDYKFRKDEIFRRLKPTTFAQLVSFVTFHELLRESKFCLMWTLMHPHTLCMCAGAASCFS